MSRHPRAISIAIATNLASLMLTPFLASSSARAGESEPAAVPVALCWGEGGKLLVALRDARRIDTVDLQTRAVVARRALPFRPNALEAGAGGVAWVGGQDGEVARVDRAGQARVIRPANGRGPTHVVPLESGDLAVISRWDPVMRVLDPVHGRELEAIALGFAPGRILRRSARELLVLDAFGGRLAAVDVAARRARGHVVDGFNLRGAAISADGRELLLGHVSQYQPLPMTSANVDWGLVVSSRLTAIELADIDADPTGTEPLPRRRLTLDGSGHGAADPGAIAVGPDGRHVFVAVTGAHQVVALERNVDPAKPGAPLDLGRSDSLEIVEVGRNPVALAVDPTGRHVVSANMCADSLSVIDTRGWKLEATIALGPGESAATPLQRGEALFLDGRRSMDRWMSCATCHPSGHAAGSNFDTLGDGGYGAAKNTPSLLGVGTTAPYGWTGSFETLGEQVGRSLVSSLRGRGASSAEMADLTAYLQSLEPPPPRRASADPNARAGAELFRELGCDTCHVPPSYASRRARDVGLDDGAGGNRRFNPPSLRGVGWSAPYFHDGRAATLDDVLELHAPGTNEPLSPRDRRLLRAFLESL